MRIHATAFTRRGLSLAVDVAAALRRAGDGVVLFCPARLADEAQATPFDDLSTWTRTAFAAADALLFVGACGIATRAIAPCVHDKLSDPAVVCVDEAARFVVPLLSGHVGGANALARRVAELTGAQCVLTTATDVNGVFAVDEWARTQGLVLVERDAAKRVSAALLEGAQVGFVSAWPVAGELPAGLVRPEDARQPLELGIVVGNDLACTPFATTLHLVAPVVVGVGCKRGTIAHALAQAIDASLTQAHVAHQAVRTLATIDVKKDEQGLRELAQERGWELVFYTAEELARVPGDFHSSSFVQKTVGVDNVCERAACADGARLVLKRQVGAGTTVALACVVPELAFPHEGTHASSCAGVVTCVGLGPGGAEDLTLRAHHALQAAEVIVGYGTYVDLVRSSYVHADFVTTPMRKEVERCRIALERAQQGQRVAMVCSGDPGVYGMAGLLFELAGSYEGVKVEVVPGVTAATGGAALLGAPLMHDWCSISLSDLMTPWETIEARLRAAATADFCICLYNPGSRGRTDHLRRACDILLDYRASSTVCGLARKVGRAGETSAVLTLEELRSTPVDMLACVFVGNSSTRVIDGHMVTPRGYEQGEAAHGA